MAEDDDSAGDQEYFAAVEARFVSRRGKSTLLSSADWQLARGWRREGIPLDLVLHGLDLAFERYRSGRRRNTLSSLRYCEPIVQQLWEERLSLGPAAPLRPVAPELDVADRLTRLAAALPAELPERETLAEAIRRLSGSAEAVESGLATLEARWLRAASGALDAESRDQLEAVIERSLAAVRARLDPAALAVAHDRLLGQALRRRFALPELSLFSSALDRDREI